VTKHIIIIITVDFVVLALFAIFEQPGRGEDEYATEALVLPVLFIINLIAGVILIALRKRK
jgi:hypothetical protein